MKFGYARCSTLGQNLDWQIDALSKEQFMAAGFNPLYPFVGKDSPTGKKLTAFMEKVGMGEEERNVIGTLVWLNAQESGDKGGYWQLLK